MTTNGDHFRTSDLYFAAFLKAAGVPFMGTLRAEGRVHFLFEKTEGEENIRDLKQSYFARVPTKLAALTYADEVRNLKSLTHQ